MNSTETSFEMRVMVGAYVGERKLIMKCLMTHGFRKEYHPENQERREIVKGDGR